MKSDLKRTGAVRPALALLSIVALGAQAQWNYTNVIDPSAPTSTHPQGVSGSTVVGIYYSGGVGNGFVYNGGSFTNLDFPSAAETFPGGIDGTNVVGTYRSVAGNGFTSHGFIYNGSTWTTLDASAGILTLASGVSGNFVVGHYNTSDGLQDSYSFLYNMTTGSFTTIDDPSAAHGAYQGTFAVGICGDIVVGSYNDNTGRLHGFLYNIKANSYTTLDHPLGANGTGLKGISGNQIVGYYLDANNVPHGFLYNGVAWATVAVPGAAQTDVAAISDNEMVGSYSDSSGNSYGFVAEPIEAATIVTNLLLATGLGSPVVNPTLNRIYLSGQGAQPLQVDGTTFAQTLVGSAGGDGVGVDLANNNLWEAGLYNGNATVWSSNNTPVMLVPLTDCPTGVNIDSANRRAWVSAQCGGGNDPVWPINADTFAILHSPIGSGGIQGPTQVNPATGRFYLTPSGVSKRITPPAYTLSNNDFGTVVGINPAANLLYAVTNNDTLQIINGAPDPEVVLTNLPLGFSFGAPIGVNSEVGRIYIGAANSNFIAVLNATNGTLLEMIPLGTNVSGVQGIAVDPGRGRVYAIASVLGESRLFVIQDAALTAITCQPVNTTVATGGTATLSVAAEGYPLLYQWFFNGNIIPGATGSTLTLRNVSSTNAGLYTVVVSNGFGSSTSQSVSLSLVDLKMFAGVVVDGPTGAQYSIQSTPSLESSSWTTLATVTLGAHPYIFIDYNSPFASKQFYRAVPLTP
jgi:hypothetical protein